MAEDTNPQNTDTTADNKPSTSKAADKSSKPPVPPAAKKKAAAEAKNKKVSRTPVKIGTPGGLSRPC